LADSFILIFLFENSHYMEITPVYKEKTKNKIIYPRINIYYYSTPTQRLFRFSINQIVGLFF